MHDIALIEELAANAVPASISQEVDGWRLRYGGGVTRRANSVLAARAGAGLTFDARLAMAEAFYARRGLPCRFQICPASRPEGIADALLARGYRTVPATNVQVGPLGPMRDHASSRAQIAAQLDDAWLVAYVAGEGETDPAKLAARRDMLQRIAPRVGFAAIKADGQIAAVALGVAERGWMGIFSVATRPEFRRRGLARSLLGDLAGWGASQGATQAYLQVHSQNRPALDLYAGLGFSTLYEYVYHEKDVASVPQCLSASVL